MSFLALGNGDRQILGTVGCAMLAAAVAGWIALGVWLDDRLGWPERYGHACHHMRGCWIDDLWYGPALLHRGNPLEILLFAILWTPVLVMIAACSRPARARRRATPGAQPSVIPE